MYILLSISYSLILHPLKNHPLLSKKYNPIALNNYSHLLSLSHIQILMNHSHMLSNNYHMDLLTSLLLMIYGDCGDLIFVEFIILKMLLLFHSIMLIKNNSSISSPALISYLLSSYLLEYSLFDYSQNITQLSFSMFEYYEHKPLSSLRDDYMYLLQT
jgi:hypothetical protein